MPSFRLIYRLGCALVLMTLWGGQVLAERIGVLETTDNIIVRSDRAPSWRMELHKQTGDIRSLLVPASGDENHEVIHKHKWSNAFGRHLGYHNFAEQGSWQATNRNIQEQISKCEVVSKSEQRAVVAIVGAGMMDGVTRYTFRQHIIFEPSGARTDLEIVNVSDDPWRCVQMFSPLWFRGGAVPDITDPAIQVWDADTQSFHPDLKNTRTQDDLVSLPPGISHPYSVRLPLLQRPGAMLLIREIAVPDTVRARNEWSLPLGFGQRPGEDGWSWWLTGGASPGAIKAEYDKGYFIAPAGKPQVFSWSFAIVNGPSDLPAEIAAETPQLPAQ